MGAPPNVQTTGAAPTSPTRRPPQPGNASDTQLTLPDLDAIRLERARRGIAPVDTTSMASSTGRFLAEMLAAAQGSPDETLGRILDALPPGRAEYIRTRLAAIDPDADPDTLANTDERGCTVHWAAEAFEPDDDDDDYIVERLIAPGGISIWFADAGSKKTWVLFHLACAVATGNDWLGFATQQGTVLLIDEESGNKRVKRRLKALLQGRGAGNKTPIAWVTYEAFDLRDPVSTARLHKVIKDVQPRLVVVDALADVIPGADENATKDVLPALLALRHIAEQHRLGVAIIHHSNRAGGYRGSSALKGAVDLMMQLESKPESADITFRTEKIRDSEPITFAAEFDYDEESKMASLLLKEGNAPKPTRKYSKSQQYVIRYLMEHGPTLLSTIMERADTCTPGAARQAVYDLAHHEVGITWRCDKGKPGEKAVYDLTAKGKDAAAHL